MAEENLFPEDYEDEVIEEDDLEEEAIGYRPGPKFDWETGDFVRDGRNLVQEATGVESWQQWCMNCMQTARNRHLAYSSDFGLDLEAVFEATSQAEAENILTQEITEALQADPYGRTEYVAGVEYEWTAPDAVEVTATVVGIEDVTIDVTAYITNE